MTRAECTARLVQTAYDLQRISAMVAEARRRLPPSLRPEEAVAKRAAAMRAAAMGRPWVTRKEA